MSEANQGFNNQTIKIIWFALFSSIFIYAAILFFGGFEPPEEPPDQIISIVFFLVGCVNISMGAFGLDLIMPVTSREQYFTTSIIKWALIESAVIMGLANGLVGGGTQVFLGLLVLAILGFLKTFPSGWTSEDGDSSETSE